jgi:hypothetical protein
MTCTSACLHVLGSAGLQVAGVGLCIESVVPARLRLLTSLATAIQINPSRHCQVPSRVVRRRFETAVLRSV